MFPVGEASKVAPYGLVGVGLYHDKEDYEGTDVVGGVTTTFSDETDIAAGFQPKPSTRLGGKFGAGAVYKATEQVGITLQAEYNIVTVDTKGVSGVPSTFKFYGVRAGVNFNVMPK